jgi:hypothetical protein
MAVSADLESLLPLAAVSLPMHMPMSDDDRHTTASDHWGDC